MKMDSGRLRSFVARAGAMLALVVAALWIAAPAHAGTVPRVVDEYGVLTQSQVSELNAKADAIAAARGLDVVILINYSLGGQTVGEFQDAYFAGNGFGLDTDRAGTMLLVSMQGRDWGLRAFGVRGQTAISPAYGQTRIADMVVPKLHNGDYYGACSDYLDLVDQFFAAENAGQPYSQSHRFLTAGDVAGRVGGGSAVGLGIGGVVVGTMKRRLNTALPEPYARNYVRDGLRLSVCTDQFRTTQVTRIPRPQVTSSNSFSGGGGGGGGWSSGVSGKF